ncbi:MAG: alpha-amylase family glycosyl hydrolase [Desertimonas sp.]
MITIRVPAPAASQVELVLVDGDRPLDVQPMRRDGDDWTASVEPGTVYGLRAHGDGPGFDPTKVLLDPMATRVTFPPGHDRRAAARRGADNAGRGPLAVATDLGEVHRPSRTTRPLAVCEIHVDGYTRRRDRSDAGTFGALADEVPRLAALGVSVIELLPVHQNDPAEHSYWGYMPLAFGAVEQRFALGGDAATELADLVTVAHDHDVEVWLDVVFNHTTEVDRSGPTYSLRGLDDRTYYRHDERGEYIDSSGCGNDLDLTSPAAQRLVRWALDRLADTGVDGFRFDLAPVLSHAPDFIAGLDEWATARRVRLIAEPWDAAGRYQLGTAWPGRRWGQWNDRFRDDMRSYLRGDEGMVPAVQCRLQGSPDLFERSAESVNFLACHDGFTLHDLVAYDHKHNEANGEDNRDGTNDNRSWNCGWEGEDGAPPEVRARRARQLRNAWCLLLLSQGTPMWAGGDEFGRTQRGNNNAYNQDNEISWVDWSRREHYLDLERFVAQLLALRAGEPMLWDPQPWGDAVSWYGVDGPVDTSHHSRSLAWQVGNLYVLTNMWHDRLRFGLFAPGRWHRVADTNLPSPDDIIDGGAGAVGPEIHDHYVVAPHSIVILRRG